MTIPEHLRHQRLYSDREVSAMLKRASELQDHADAGVRQGLPYAQIESFASGLGIDLEVLRAAAVELEQRDLEHGTRTFWGGPFEFAIKRIAPGALTPARAVRLTDALAALKPRMNERRDGHIHGTVRSHLTGSLHIHVDSTDSHTTIRLHRTFTHAAALAYSLGIALSLIAAISAPLRHHTLWVETLIFAGSLLLGLTVARLSLGLWIRTQRKRLKQLADRLRDLSSTSQS
ncbi:MAG: hypothetical protein R2834_05340 [Rhodothermales bacterium]